VAPAYARRTDRQREALLEIAFALGEEAGARLAAKLKLGVSPDTLLHYIRSTRESETGTPSVLGMDDWAWRRGHRYGTILVNLERHCVVDLLPDRRDASLSSWLKWRPGARVISRDRGGEYAEGARQGAPDAVQVADRSIC
jgi:transposase